MTGTPQDSQLWLVGAVVGPVVAAAVILVVVCLFVKHRDRRMDKLHLDSEPGLVSVQKTDKPSKKTVRSELVNDDMSLSLPVCMSLCLFQTHTQRHTHTHTHHPDFGDFTAQANTSPSRSTKLLMTLMTHTYMYTHTHRYFFSNSSSLFQVTSCY